MDVIFIFTFIFRVVIWSCWGRFSSMVVFFYFVAFNLFFVFSMVRKMYNVEGDRFLNFFLWKVGENGKF